MARFDAAAHRSDQQAGPSSPGLSSLSGSEGEAESAYCPSLVSTSSDGPSRADSLLSEGCGRLAELDRDGEAELDAFAASLGPLPSFGWRPLSVSSPIANTVPPVAGFSVDEPCPVAFEDDDFMGPRLKRPRVQRTLRLPECPAIAAGLALAAGPEPCGAPPCEPALFRAAGLPCTLHDTLRAPFRVIPPEAAALVRAVAACLRPAEGGLEAELEGLRVALSDPRTLNTALYAAAAGRRMVAALLERLPPRDAAAVAASLFLALVAAPAAFPDPADARCMAEACRNLARLLSRADEPVPAAARALAPRGHVLTLLKKARSVCKEAHGKLSAEAAGCQVDLGAFCRRSGDVLAAVNFYEKAQEVCLELGIPMPEPSL